MAVTYICAGFLSGNLWEGCDPGRYQDALSGHLRSLFPEAEIDCPYQDAEGSLPAPLELYVEDDAYDVDKPDTYDAGLREVEAAWYEFDRDICADPTHYVWAQE